MSGEQLRADLEELEQAAAQWRAMAGELHPGVPPEPGAPIWPTAVVTGAVHSGVQISTVQLTDRLTNTANGLAGATNAYTTNEQASADALGNVTGTR